MRSEDGTANGKANAQTGEMRSIRTNGAVRRSVNENSDGNAARRILHGEKDADGKADAVIRADGEADGAEFGIRRRIHFFQTV